MSLKTRQRAERHQHPAGMGLSVHRHCVDARAKLKGVEMAKMYFGKSKNLYVLFHIQYLDDTDVHIA